MKKIEFLSFSVILLLTFSFLSMGAAAQDDLMKKAQSTFQPIPMKAPAKPGKVFTAAKIDLGKRLFFDPRLSKSSLISCNACHNLGLGGADYQETSTGHGWQKGPRNAPTVLNSVFNIAQFWDGRASDLKEQAKGPVQAGVEMNNTPEMVVKTLESMPQYVWLFTDAFPGQANPVTFDNMAEAIEAFEATLLTPDSSFDRFLKGDGNALTGEEKEGLRVFMDKGCAGCHGGVNMGGTGYYPFGVVQKPAAEVSSGDRGRYKVTGSQDDEYLFKSPSLRNIELTLPYFHSGKVWSLRDAVGIMGSVQLGITLTAEEGNKIVAFLKSTTGVQPDVTYPLLPTPSSTTPRPRLN